MRNLFFILIITLVLQACGAAPNTLPASNTRTSKSNPMPTGFKMASCIDVRQPTPNPKEASLFAPINNTEHILGSNNAYVTVLVYSDFQCAACAKLAPLLKSLVQKYPADIRVVFRHFPLESIHDKAGLSAQAAEAADLQGKFWQMHDFLFLKQSEWLNKKPEDFRGWIITQSITLGLNPSKFESDLSNPDVLGIVKTAWEEGQKIKLPGAPVILINGEIIKWQVNLLDQLEDFVLLARLPKQQFDSCPPLVIDPSKNYTARLKTTRGDVLIKLFTDKAPSTVNNFIFLAKKGWYDNIPFFQVIPGYLAQTGDPTGTGMGNPGYFIPSEKNSSLVYDRAGMLGMSNSGPNTNGSQFFITLAAAPGLNKDYPIFGEVISGLDVLIQLNPRDRSNTNSLLQADMLINVTIEEK